MPTLDSIKESISNSNHEAYLISFNISVRIYCYTILRFQLRARFQLIDIHMQQQIPFVPGQIYTIVSNVKTFENLCFIGNLKNRQ